MGETTPHTTRIALDARRHITVDWRVSGFDVPSKQWQVSAVARMWESTELRSGVRLAVKPLTNEVTLLVEGTVFEHVLAQLMRDAYELCLAALPH